MRSMFGLVATGACLMVLGSPTPAWAEKSGKKLIPDSINKQFEWEEKVVGPREGIDHDKIEAMQAQARKDDEAQRNRPVKRAARGEGVQAPASSTLPTMDIEKPAPAGSVRQHKPRPPKVEEAKPRDALDNLLAENQSEPEAKLNSDRGLKKALASNSKRSHNKKARHKKHKRSKRSVRS